MKASWSFSRSFPHTALPDRLSHGWQLAILLGVFFVAVGMILPQSMPPSPIPLPILVYAPDGTSPHVETIVLNVQDATAVDSLYVKAHQPFYHRGGHESGQHEGFDVAGAASIQINDEAWVDVRDETIGCPSQERRHARCVGGVFSTIRFTLPAPRVHPGANTVRFRFNGSDGIRSGYRVLGVGFMRPSDPAVQWFDPLRHGAHDPTPFVYTDASTWGPPQGYETASDAAAGREWFSSASLLEGPSGRRIQASCGDCHARNGRDLAYFGYSNRTIEARSRFHGLSDDQAYQIAAYIRSLQLKTRDGSPYAPPGTPWDPPYQPGPTLTATGEHPDASDPVYWAAGAGLDAVLNREVDMLPHLFPDGEGGVDYYTTPHGTRALRWRHLHMDSTLNMRAIPLSIQYPDWNNWLPDLHPKDAFPTQWEASRARAAYEGPLRTVLATHSGSTDRQALRAVDREIRRFHNGFTSDLKNAANETNLSENLFSLARLSNHQWLATKAWETFHTHHLEDVADDLYGDDPMQPFTEPRSWLGDERFLFNVGPHIALPNGIGGGPPYQYGSQYMDQLMSHVWYQLQVSVNPGARPGSSTQRPVDWNYHNSFLKAAPHAGLRNVASHIKANQLLSNGYGVDGSGGKGYNRGGFVKGWEPFTIDPERFLLLRGHYRYNHLSPALRQDLYTATLRAFNDFHTRFPVAEFPRGYDEFRYNPSDYVPKAWGHTNPRWHGQKIYQGLYETGQQFPEAYGAIDTLAAWGAQMWPVTEGPHWNDLVDYRPPGEGAPPTVAFTTPSHGAYVSGPAVRLAAEVTDPDGNVADVSYYVGNTLVGRARRPPFEIQWENVPINTYEVHVRVRDTENLAARDTLTITVGPSRPIAANEHGLYYAYLRSHADRGEVPNFDSLIPTRGGIAPRPSISQVYPSDKHFAARFFGYLEVPEEGVYTFYTYSSDGSVLSIGGQRVVDNDGRHPFRERAGKIALTKGRHPIDIGYFMRGGRQGLLVRWAGPGFEKTPLPDENLWLSPAPQIPQ